MRILRGRYEGKAALNTDDGLKIETSDYWLHVRPTNTEPIIRILVEARTRARAKEVLGAFRKEIEEVAPWR